MSLIPYVHFLLLFFYHFKGKSWTKVFLHIFVRFGVKAYFFNLINIWMILVYHQFQDSHKILSWIESLIPAASPFVSLYLSRSSIKSFECVIWKCLMSMAHVSIFKCMGSIKCEQIKLFGFTKENSFTITNICVELTEGAEWRREGKKMQSQTRNNPLFTHTCHRHHHSEGKLEKSVGIPFARQRSTSAATLKLLSHPVLRNVYISFINKWIRYVIRNFSRQRKTLEESSNENDKSGRLNCKLFTHFSSSLPLCHTLN